jgi:hypothetical protein
MNVENLAQLSFEQLDEIQRRISTAISDKKSMRVGDAASDILDLLATKYSEIELWHVINELAFRSQLKLDLNSNSVDYETALEISENLSPGVNFNVLPPNIQLLAERLKSIRNSVLQSDDSRLLWLTNGGTQKTSKMFGKDLAEVLQEAIKRLERLDVLDDEEESTKDLNLEVVKIDEWAEFKLGISLLYGTLTVINPFSSRASQLKDSPRMSQRAPVTEGAQSKANLELHFPLSQRRVGGSYAHQ